MGTPNDIVQSSLYEGIASGNEYTMMPGVCILPLAEDPPTDMTELAEYSPVVIARLHAPYRIRKYSSAAQKQNNPSVVQTPQDTGAFVFIGGSLAFYNQFNGTWWNSDWTVNASYLFVENCVSRPQDGFVLGSATPFTNDADSTANSYYLGNSLPDGQITIGAVAEAGPNAQAGFIYGQVMGGLPPTSQPTEIDPSDSQTPSSGGSTGSTLPLGLITAWNYTMTSFYPGTLLNDDLMIGGGV